MHPLDVYLADLTEDGHISDKERQAISAALAPWRYRFTGLSTVERVREEFRAEAATVDSVRRDKLAAWQTPSAFPWFDLEKALSNFMAKPSRADLHMTFRSEAARAVQRTYVDPALE